jgi:hypothetical protein
MGQTRNNGGRQDAGLRSERLQPLARPRCRLHGELHGDAALASYMETLLMTERGIEVLSSRPRTLTVVGG